MVLLLYISYINIYLSTYFYKVLRENPGKIGPRGDQGDQGPKGDDGVCKLEEQCGRVDCQKYTEQILAQNIEGYDQILKKINEGVILEGEDDKINKTVGKFIQEILLPMCNSGKYSNEEYKQKIIESIN